MVRLFVALEFPLPIRERLAALAGGVPGARWEPVENLHLTLRFIGEVDRGRLDDLDAALVRIDAPAFALTLNDVGSFGTGGKARVVWAGVEPCDGLTHLQAKVESAVVRTGVPPESRRFAPHVTLARLNGAPADRLQRFLVERAGFRAGPVAIGQFALFESHPGRRGSIYTVLKAYPLRHATD